MVRRRRFLLLVLAVLVGIAGVLPAERAGQAAAVSPTGIPRPGGSPLPRAGTARQVQDLLDARAAAVRSRDRAAFLETVDPAETAFVASQAAWFDRLGAVPIAVYRLDLDHEEDLTRTQDRRRYGAPVVVAPVVERLRFEGSQDVPLAGALFLTFVRRQGRWRIASDSGVEDLGLVSSRHPWDFGPVSVHASEHFLLMVHPGEQAHAPELLALAEQALSDVGRVWLRPWDMHVPLQVPSSPDELLGYLGGGLDVSKFVAFALSSYDPDNGWRWDASRVVVHRQNFLALPPPVRRAVLAHELAHVASTAARGPFALTFVEEGLADLAAGDVGGPQLAAQVRAGRFNRRLPDDFEFVSGSQEEIQAAYQKSSSAFAYMRSRFGVEGVNRFYEAYGSPKLAPGTSRYHADQAFRSALGLPLEAFEREWARSVAP